MLSQKTHALNVKPDTDSAAQEQNANNNSTQTNTNTHHGNTNKKIYKTGDIVLQGTPLVEGTSRVPSCMCAEMVGTGKAGKAGWKRCFPNQPAAAKENTHIVLEMSHVPSSAITRIDNTSHNTKEMQIFITIMS